MASRDHNFRNPSEFAAATDKISGWLSNRGWEIEFFSRIDDCIDFTNKKIYVNGRRTPQSQIFGALHEAGHLILSETADYKERFRESDDLHRRAERVKEPLKVRVQTLGEEWEAWCLGERLAQQLDIRINISSFYTARDKDIKTYASWVADGV
jgi:Zn-dependent peptidase ImmA (M78 family)